MSGAAMAAVMLTAARSVAAQAVPAGGGRELTVDRIFRTGEFRAATLPETHWLRDGESFVDVRDAGAGSEIVRTDAVTGRTTVVVPASALIGTDGRPLRVEHMILSPDEREALLFHDSQRVWRENTKGQWMAVDLASGRLRPISPSTGPKMFATFSPDGHDVAYVRDNDLYVWDIKAGTERRLTTDGSANIINGTTDWVYEEEFDLRDAFRWSPDGRHIAFWRFDQSHVPMMTLVNLTDSLYPTFDRYRYPKAGEPNSVVRIGVIAVAGGATRWMDVGRDTAQYIPRMGWTGPDSLWIERMPRGQNRSELLMASISTGRTRRILADSDRAYVDVVDPYWLDGGRELLWMSDRSGWRQLYLYDRSGRMVRQLTRDGADVLDIAGVDSVSGSVYVTEAAPAATQRQIYRYALNGSGGGLLTMRPGSYRMSLAPGGRYAALTWSDLNTPPTMTLHALPSMRRVRVLGGNAQLEANLHTLGLARATFLKIPAADGTTMLDAYRIVPPGFDSTRKYPVLMYAYGGPATPQVVDTWGGSRWMFHQMVAQHGYVVVVADNRGAAWRGTHFRKQTQNRLGLIESDDQIAVARWIGHQPWGNAARIGMWGWSFGGYLTAMSAFRGGAVFRMAISVAPVTDWRFYDTIYTERFMGTPQQNPEGYRVTAPLSYVDGLRARYLLVHGTGDDNVHLQNSVVLTQRLQLARKPFVEMFFPNKTHALAGRGGTLPLFDLLERFVLENL